MASVVFGRKRLAIDISVKKKDDGWLIQPLSNHDKMTVSEFIPLLRNHQFAEKLSQTFLSLPSKAVYFVSSDISEGTLDKPINFTVKEDPYKKGMYPNYSYFSRSMNSWGYAHNVKHKNGYIIFPHASEKDFSHFMTFLKNSDEEERASLWNEVSKFINPNEKPVQIKTTLEQIPWLNIHISP